MYPVIDIENKVLCKLNSTCTGTDLSLCGTDTTLYVCVNDKCQCSDISYSSSDICKKYLDPLTSVQLKDVNINSLKVTWTKPVTVATSNVTYGIILFGRKDLSEPSTFPNSEDTAIIEDVKIEEHIFHNLTSFWDYKASIFYFDNDLKRLSKQTFTDVQRTLGSAPGLVDDKNIYSAVSSINVTWSCPREKQRHGIITTYVLTYEVTGSNDTKAVTKSSLDGIDCKFFASFPTLPKTVYTVTIRADTATNEGEVFEFEPHLSFVPYKTPEIYDNFLPILGIFGALAFIVITVVVFILYQRGKLPCV